MLLAPLARLSAQPEVSPLNQLLEFEGNHDESPIIDGNQLLDDEPLGNHLDDEDDDSGENIEEPSKTPTPIPIPNTANTVEIG